MFAAPDVVKIPIQIAKHYQVEQSVVVEINPRCTCRPTFAAYARLAGDVRKGAVAIVVIELVSAKRGDVYVFVAVVVVVSNRNSHSITGTPQPSPFGHVLEGPVGLLVIEAIPVSRVDFLGNRSCRHRIA